MNNYSIKLDKNKEKSLKEFFVNDNATISEQQYAFWRAKTPKYTAVFYTSGKFLIQGSDITTIVAKTEEFLGKANSFQEVSFLAKTDIEKETYRKALAIKKKEDKMMKNYIRFDSIPSNQSIVENLIASLDTTEFKSSVKVSRIANTSMDKVAQKVKKEAALKASSLKISYETPIQPKRRIFLTESEKRRWEEQQAKLAQNA